MKAYWRRYLFVAVLFAGFGTLGILMTQEGGRIPLSAEQISLAVGATEFCWSPDGKSLAYITAASGTSEIWVVPSAGGRPTRITASGNPKQKPMWSPDGSWIAYVEETLGQGDIRLVSPDGSENVAFTENIEDERDPQWAPDSKAVSFRQTKPGSTRLIRQELESKAVLVLTDEGTFEHRWSPDGRWIAYVADPLLPNDSRRDNQDIYIVASSGGVPRLMTPGTQRFRDYAPTWSQDSKRLAFLSESTGFSNVYLIGIDGTERRSLNSVNVDLTAPRWSPDGALIAYVRNEDNRFHIFATPVDGGRTIRLSDKDGANGGFEHPDGAPRGSYAWSPDGKRLAYTFSSPGRAPELWVVNSDGSRPSQLTQSMPSDLRRESRFVWPDPLVFRSFDGEEIRGLVYKPRGPKPRAGHPTVLFFRETVDGQHAMSWDPFVQYLVSNGFLVFAPNVRGSAGRGRDFRQMIYQHGGDHDVRDAFIGLDRLSAEGMVASEQVGVLGAGTGGFLATAAVIRDETRFRAAASLYGIVDAASAFSYPTMEAWTRYMIGATPMTNARSFYERSILNFVDKLRTPIVFIYASDDGSAPVQQLHQFAVSAEVNAKWFDYQILQNEPRGYLRWRPQSLRVALEGVGALFERFLQGKDRDIKLTRNK